MSQGPTESALSVLSPHAVVWRRLAYLGARHGPLFWLHYSPPMFGWLAAVLLARQR